MNEMSACIQLWKGVFNTHTPSCVSTTCYILITWEVKGNDGVCYRIGEAVAIALVNMELLSKWEKMVSLALVVLFA